MDIKQTLKYYQEQAKYGDLTLEEFLTVLNAIKKLKTLCE